MDALDEVMDTAGPLLRRVDELLSGLGAPPDHEVWTEMRRVRLLPDWCWRISLFRQRHDLLHRRQTSRSSWFPQTLGSGPLSTAVW